MSKEERNNRLSWERKETSKLDYEKRYMQKESDKRKLENE
jgi:hypothetical protein